MLDGDLVSSLQENESLQTDKVTLPQTETQSSSIRLPALIPGAPQRFSTIADVHQDNHQSVQSVNPSLTANTPGSQQPISSVPGHEQQSRQQLEISSFPESIPVVTSQPSENISSVCTGLNEGTHQLEIPSVAAIFPSFNSQISSNQPSQMRMLPTNNNIHSTSPVIPTDRCNNVPNVIPVNSTRNQRINNNAVRQNIHPNEVLNGVPNLNHVQLPGFADNYTNNFDTSLIGIVSTAFNYFKHLYTNKYSIIFIQ